MMLALFWQVYLPFGFLFCEKSVHVFCSLKKKKGFSFPYWFTRVLEIFWIQALHWYLYSNYRLPLCGLHFHRLNGVFWWTEALNFDILDDHFLLLHFMKIKKNSSMCLLLAVLDLCCHVGFHLVMVGGGATP